MQKKTASFDECQNVVSAVTAGDARTFGGDSCRVDTWCLRLLRAGVCVFFSPMIDGLRESRERRVVLASKSPDKPHFYQ